MFFVFGTILEETKKNFYTFVFTNAYLMKNKLHLIIGIIAFLVFSASTNQSRVNTEGTTIETRIPPPTGFSREISETNSFTQYLRSLPLKAQGAKVLLYDNSIKPNQTNTFAVVDMDIENADLQQCADAIIRLRAEYLWKQKRYSEIHFNFSNDTQIDYVKWAEGQRLKVRGNKITWEKKAERDYSYDTFRKYLNKIFMYAGTASLAREMIAVPYNQIEPGDVFIHGGNPGHAMIVVDVATNPETKQKAFICAQSFTPAQEIEIVNNCNEIAFSPWYFVNEKEMSIAFPQWTFSCHELKRFK